MTCVSIDILKAAGACDQDCARLALLYPDGGVVLAPSELPRMRDAGVYVFHAVRLLSIREQHSLARFMVEMAVGDRGIQYVDCIDATVDDCNAEIFKRRRDQLEARAASDVELSNLHGILYVFARLCRLYALGCAENSHEVMIAFDILRQWFAKCMEFNGSGGYDDSLRRIESKIFEMTDYYGISPLFEVSNV